ncbi:MAG TPA: glycosyltransferase family protein [Candidatus Sumerlaeota bacterium]|nr:glycosyltransferase family protein [Candidatus Sumerlaeota bacterium]HNM46843.1 glycosyltransferase family protein [Candidatus Sumerlaeota bacterium]
MKPRFLFCVVGVGAGNTTRNLAILRELQSIGDCEILIAAQGNARKLLSQHYKTIGLHDISYSTSGKFSPLSVIKSNLGFPYRFWQNMKASERIMRDFKPDLVVADSDFYCLRPARRLGLKLAAINNSALIVEFIRADGTLPSNCRFSYNVIERSDYWLQRRYPQRVLCPDAGIGIPLPKKFVPIPPMVRPDIVPLTEPGDEIVVLTSGSGLDVDTIDLTKLKNQKIRMLGTRLTKVPDGAQFVGFTLDVMEHMRRAKVLVIQGGFSSLSEALKLRVPTVIIPIANHAEQWVNGRVVEKLGLGRCARDAAHAGDEVMHIIENYDQYWKTAQAIDAPTDGHIVAARNLWEWAHAKTLD